MPPGDRYTVETIMGSRVRYVVPSFYQRAYVWTLEKQWVDLWADIRRKTIELADARSKIGSDRSVQLPLANHFMGAFVVNAVPAFGFYPPRKDVIDGQQRLTTIQILLNAFQHVAAQVLGRTDQMVAQLETLTHNTSADREYEYKVWPTEADQDLFRKIMSRSRDEVLQYLGVEPTKPGRQPKQKTSGIDGAYFFFHEEILAFLTKDERDAVLDTGASRTRAYDLYEVIVQRMDLVMIELNENDDPQVIFEALNGRGTPLLPSDLIKNHVFESVRAVCPDSLILSLLKVVNLLAGHLQFIKHLDDCRNIHLQGWIEPIRHIDMHTEILDRWLSAKTVMQLFESLIEFVGHPKSLFAQVRQFALSIF
jgi:hypothetical protein